MRHSFVLIGLLFIAPVAAGEVRYERPEPSANPHILITGQIVEGDYHRFVEAVRIAHARDVLNTLYVSLETPGGSVVEAMRIGEVVRSLQLTTINIRGICNSACFFILIAGVERITASGIGVHRPHFDREQFAALSHTQAKAAYDQLLANVRSYLEEMGAPEALIETMYAVPSNEIYHLSSSETTAWVPRAPTALDEWLIAKCGSYTKQESQDYSAHLVGAGSFSPGYVDYLETKIDQVDGCRMHERIKARRKAVQALLVDSSP